MSQSLKQHFKQIKFDLQQGMKDEIQNIRKAIETYETYEGILTLQSLMVDDREIHLQNIRKDISIAKNRLKFYIYTHNLDVKNMKRIHERLNEKEIERLEEVNELIENDEQISMCCVNPNEGEIDQDGEGGYLQLANDIKSQNSNREFLVDNLTKWKSEGLF